MKQRQINKKNMYDTVSSYLDEHATIWQAIARIGTAKVNLDELRQQISNQATVQAASQATYGKTKLALKNSIAIKADILNDLLEVKALMDGDEELARQMSDTKTDLYQMKYDDLIVRVKFIIAKALEQEEVLVPDFGMTQEQVTDLQGDVNELEEMNGKPREYQIKSGVATAELEVLFDQTDDLLYNQLDNLMKIFKNRNRDFYEGYRRARMIVDY